MYELWAKQVCTVTLLNSFYVTIKHRTRVKKGSTGIHINVSGLELSKEISCRDMSLVELNGMATAPRCIPQLTLTLYHTGYYLTPCFVHFLGLALKIRS